jgi:hypothetical protein
MIIIFIYTMATLEEPLFIGKPYPTYCYVIGWLIFAIGVSQFLFWSLWEVLKSENKLQTLKALLKKNPLWGPNSSRLFKEWTDYKVEKQTTQEIQSKNHSQKKKNWSILTGKYD